MSLDSFFGSYLNQDYGLISGSPDECVADFGRLQPAEEVAAARAEMVDLLARTAGDDEALDRAAAAYGCGWAPADLTELRTLFQSAVDQWGAESPVDNGTR